MLVHSEECGFHETDSLLQPQPSRSWVSASQPSAGALGEVLLRDSKDSLSAAAPAQLVKGETRTQITVFISKQFFLCYYRPKGVTLFLGISVA